MKEDNCVVCKKYLKEIDEQETLMCTDCDKKTAKVAKEQEALNINYVTKR